jgi:hypothetical protein
MSLFNGFYLIGEGMYNICKGISGNYSLNKKILSNKEARKKDREALKNDWKVVGKDLENIIGESKE